MELLVALSVFSIVVGLVVGIFVQGLRSQRLLTSMIGVNSNMSLVLEQMAREIRAGFRFSTGGVGCPGGGTQINFERTRPGVASFVPVYYSWDSAAETVDRSENNANPEPLTASNIAVKNLCFVLKHNSASDPWRVTIIATVAPTDKQFQGQQEMIQTTVSARTLPFELP